MRFVTAPTEPAWLRHVLRLAALGLGALHAAVAVKSHSMNEDGINYLDMGAAWMHGDWQAAVNAIWSPLYAVVLGAVVEAVQPSVWWEFPLVQATNVAIFAVTLACFEFFWRQLTVSYYEPTEEPTVRLPRTVWLVLGYSLFIWSSLNLIEIWAVTPDMLLASCIYVSAGLLLATGRQGSRRCAVLLGVVLGLGYLAKAALFPLGLVFIVLASLIRPSTVRPAQRLTWSLVSFAVVAGPFLVAVSVATGSPTFSDVGRFTYLKHVNTLRYPHWGDSIRRVSGTPEHPPRLVFENPPVYEFAEPIAGTYPMAFDPGYWTRGLSPRADLGQQLQAVISNLRLYFDLFMRALGGFTAVSLLMGLAAWQAGVRPRWFSAESALVVWALCALGMYALVYVSPRYIGVFVLLLWSGLLSGIRLPDSASYRALANTGGGVLVLMIWVNIAAFNVEGLTAMRGFYTGLPTEAPVEAASGRFDNGRRDHPAIAEGLLRLGVRAGDRVGFVGYSFSAFWARLARVRIVAEIEPMHESDFWAADAERQADVLEAFAAAGATAVVAQATSAPPGWQPVGETGHVVRFLNDIESRR